jgi:hypothetical protein
MDASVAEWFVVTSWMWMSDTAPTSFGMKNALAPRRTEASHKRVWACGQGIRRHEGRRCLHSIRASYEMLTCI